MELYTLPGVETRRSADIETGPHEVWHWKVEENCQLQVSLREVHRSDIHADSETARSAITW